MRCRQLETVREKALKELKPARSIERKRVFRVLEKIYLEKEKLGKKCKNKECEDYFSNLEWPQKKLCQRCTKLNKRRTRHNDNNNYNELTKKALYLLQFRCFNHNCCLYHIYELKQKKYQEVVDPEGVILKYSPAQS